MSNLRPGTYRVRGVEAGLGMTGGDSPKEQVAVRLEILSEGFEGETITYFGYFTEKTTERTLESLRLRGWTGDDLFDLSSIDGSAEARAVIEEDSYNGEVRLKVKWINGFGGLSLKTPMNDAQAKSFAARMKGAAIASRTKPGAKTATPAQPRGSQARHDSPPPHGDDDIPF